MFSILLINYLQMLRSGWQFLRQLHRIPCSRCVYFTVNPGRALSIEAIKCPDFTTSLH
ncbi:MAG: hypothetical protein LDL47_02380 [Cyanobacteria bacterium KgW148]|nr:hypothetical protein [Cyanobacteria bacterium KgW148]